MSVIDDYKKLRQSTLDLVDHLKRSQPGIMVEVTGHNIPPVNVRDIVNDLIHSREFLEFFVAVCDKKLAGAGASGGDAEWGGCGVMFLDTPRVVARWTDSTCATAEEWIETSDGRVYKGQAGSAATVVIGPSHPKPAVERMMNRHDRRAAASGRSWKKRKVGR